MVMLATGFPPDANAKGIATRLPADSSVPTMSFSRWCTTFALMSLLPACAAGQEAARRQAREQWFLRGRTGTPARARLQPRAQTVSRPIAQAIRNSDGWMPLGPQPLVSQEGVLGQQDYGATTGRVTAIAIDPNDQTANTVYAGGAFGGVWKSSNAASAQASQVTWQPLTDDQATLAIGAIAVQPSGTVVLAGTGETNSAIDSYYGLGILRSNDSGANWTLISQDQNNHSFVGLGFSKIVFSKANPNLVMAATAGTSQGGIDGIPVESNVGIYFSNDAGTTWNRAVIRDGGTPISSASVTSLVYNDALQTFFAAVRFHGFYKLAAGNIWLRLAAQPGDTLLDSAVCPVIGSAGCPIYRGELAAVPGRNEIYAWYVDSNNTDMGISRSVDGGASWQALNDTTLDSCGDPAGCGTEDGAYNLALAVVPDGDNPGMTDIYAAAANIYKCRSVGMTSDCSLPQKRTFINLTHASGCAAGGASPRVHPAQHAIDFLQVAGGTQVVMYFANDGGVYRSLDGYAGLSSGDCAAANNFENLNQRLGSLAQFISLAQHPTDANTLLGGAPGAGFPATGQALSDPVWRNANASGGGFAAIAPINPLTWFTANGASSIETCPFGAACQTSDFASRQIVNSATLGGDIGPEFTPFLLDPSDPGGLLVGTCRIWRGQTDGSGFVAVSVNFETGSDAGCDGQETNQVRTLAAFQTGSFPEIIYAGTDGFGPLAPRARPAGISGSAMRIMRALWQTVPARSTRSIFRFQRSPSIPWTLPPTRRGHGRASGIRGGNRVRQRRPPLEDGQWRNDLDEFQWLPSHGAA